MDELLDIYSAVSFMDRDCNRGNCKRCINRSGCGNKNKKEANRCSKYRPEIKIKKRKKK